MAPVTYCFTVTNTGSTHLASIVVTDQLVAGNAPVLLSADSACTTGLRCQSARYFVEAHVPPPTRPTAAFDDTFINTASASALPVEADGNSGGGGWSR